MAIEFVGSSSADRSNAGTLSVPLPDGTTTGDTIIVFAHGGAVGMPGSANLQAPSGWDERWKFITGNLAEVGCSYVRRVTNITNEPTSINLVFSASGGLFRMAGATAVSYRGVDSSQPFAIPVDSVLVNPASPWSIPAITTDVDGARLIAAFAHMTPEITPGEGMSGVSLRGGWHTVASYGSLYDMHQYSSGSTGSVGGSGGNITMAYLTALRPSTGPTAHPWSRAYIVE